MQTGPEQARREPARPESTQLGPDPVVVPLAVLAFLASAGFAASLPLQERLSQTIEPAVRGQAFGLYSTGLMVGQAIGAVTGGLLATRLGATPAMDTLAVLSLCVTATLTPALRRSGQAGQAGAAAGTGDQVDHAQHQQAHPGVGGQGDQRAAHRRVREVEDPA